MRLFVMGKAGAGKSEVVKHLVDQHGFIDYELSGKIKAVAEDLFGLTTKNRAFLQQLGAKMRELDPEVWIKYVAREIEWEEPKRAVVQAVRYRNEYDYFRDCGFKAVLVTAPLSVRLARLERRDGTAQTNTLGHISETDLDGLEADRLLVNDGSISDLQLQVDKLVRSL